MCSIDTLMSDFQNLTITTTTPLCLPMTEGCMSQLLYFSDFRQVLQHLRVSKGFIDSDKMLPILLALFNEMATNAKAVAERGGLQFIHVDYEMGPRPKDCENIPVRQTEIHCKVGEASLRCRVKEIIALIWSKVFGVTVSCTAEYFYDIPFMKLSWQEANPYLLPRPRFCAPTNAVSARHNHLAAMVNNEIASDVCFTVKDKTISAHAVFLFQADFFKAELSGRFKEHIGQNKEAIVFPNFDSETFLHMLHFLYTGEVKPEWIQNIDSCLELLHLASFVQCRSLTDICIAECYNLISEETYIPILITQLLIQDPDLDKLCDWFAKFKPSFVGSLELETVPPIELLTLILASKKYNIRNLETRCADCLKRKLTLDNGFVELCAKISEMKDPSLESILREAVKQRPEIYDAMYAERKGKYKQQWQAYKPLMLNPKYR